MEHHEVMAHRGPPEGGIKWTRMDADEEVISEGLRFESS